VNLSITFLAGERVRRSEEALGCLFSFSEEFSSLTPEESLALSVYGKKQCEGGSLELHIRTRHHVSRKRICIKQTSKNITVVGRVHDEVKYLLSARGSVIFL
jgi:hypothetical protein